MRSFALVFLLASSAAHSQLVSLPRLRLLEAARGFANPVGIEFEQDGQHRMFVVEKAGRIRIVTGGQVLATPFLSITSMIATGDEQGLLGLAIPPGFNGEKYFYVNYTRANGDTIIARFRVSASDPNVADPASQEVILEIDQPAANHNGGQIRFGPDGYLYIGMGDGGGGNDTFHNGQNRQSLLGKILRIDVEGLQKPYGIPPTNPFVSDASYRPEIWALGVRNPWRFSFDRVTGDLWIADVGQSRAEEIDFQPASSHGGENYGWPIMEGLQCLTGSSCDQTGLTLPIHEYTRENGDISTTGGFRYRGPTPGLNAPYLFSDFSSGRIWSLIRIDTPYTSSTEVKELRGPGLNVSTFGQDVNGDLFLADYGGVIYRLDLLSAVNAANSTAGISPGSMASAFVYGMRDSSDSVGAQSVPLPTELGGVQLLVNGAAAPLYSVTDRQVEFQPPFDLSTSTETMLTIRRSGATLAEFSTSPVAVNAGIFSYAGTSTPILVHSVNFSPIDDAHPADRGEYVSFYAAGLGPVNGPPPTGAATPLDRLVPVFTLPQVRIAGAPCEVQFAGLAPGLIGVYQVNIRIAAGVPSGVQDLVLTLGASSATAQIRIR